MNGRLELVKCRSSLLSTTAIWALEESTRMRGFSAVIRRRGYVYKMQKYRSIQAANQCFETTHQKEHVDRLVVAVGDFFEFQREQVRIENVLAGVLYLLDVGGLGDLNTVRSQR